MSDIAALVDKPIGEGVEQQASERSPDEGRSYIGGRAIDPRCLAMDIEIVKFDYGNPVPREHVKHVFVREVFAMLVLADNRAGDY